MKIIGITGGIASGKTEVTKIFQKHGFEVINSDEIGHQYLANVKVKEQILSMYGETVLMNGEIDRKKLGEIIFSNPEERKRLNQLIHPLVIADIMSRIQKAYENGHQFIIIESALIGEDEDRLPEWLNALILVVCPEEIRIKRLMNTRNLSYEEAKMRIQSQKVPEEKIKLARWIITNDGDLEKLNKETEKIIKEIINGNG